MSIQSVIRLIFTLCAVVALPFALTGCEDIMSSDTGDTQVISDPAPQNVQQDPPRMRAEIIPVIDNPTAEIWRPGYWAMSYNHFVWVPGRVIARPSPTAVWATARWAHHTYGWCFEEGHWE